MPRGEPAWQVLTRSLLKGRKLIPEPRGYRVHRGRAQPGAGAAMMSLRSYWLGSQLALGLRVLPSSPPRPVPEHGAP